MKFYTEILDDYCTTEGYVAKMKDIEYHWVCKECFDDFKEEFKWSLTHEK
jgi:hypothetical protein